MGRALTLTLAKVAYLYLIVDSEACTGDNDYRKKKSYRAVTRRKLLYLAWDVDACGEG